MPTIHVVKKFILTTKENPPQVYVPGVYEVDDETASHWFVQPHLYGYTDNSAPAVGTPAYVAMAKQRAEETRLAYEAATEAAKAAEAAVTATQPAPVAVDTTAKPKAAKA